jgi:phenylpropionate dioxygenase-like ring-hydroxylating dioxygenase large terminal subunit
MDCRWNWKLMCDNFMEPYHHVGTHRASLEPLMPARMSEPLDGDGAYSVVYMHQRAGGGDGYGAPVLPVLEGLTEAERRRAVLVHVFPNGLISVYPDHMEFYRTFPDGPDRTRLEKLMCVPPAVASRPAFEAEMRQVVRGFEEIRDEDVAVCLAVQRGLAAGLAKASPLCYLEKPIWRFARWVDGQVRARRPRRLLGSPPESDMSEEPRARRRGTGKGGSSRSERRLGRRLRGGKSGGSSETPLKF